MSKQLEYDVLILGGGTAGTAAAKAAHAAGAKTAMFNKGELGGLCILRGCMPTKTMLHAAHLAHEAQHHHTPGIGHAVPTIDFGAVMENKGAKVARFKAAKVRGIESAGYEVIDVYARFSGPDTVLADNGVSYRFRKGAVIATGSVPHIPDLPGIGTIDYWTSDDVMQLTERPDSAIVIGSGAIGLELAQFLARMGTTVTLCSRRPVFCDVDPVIATEVENVLNAEANLELIQSFAAREVQGTADGVELVLDMNSGEERRIQAQNLIVATGRNADLADLGLELAGVEFAGSRVAHDDEMRTTNPNVFVAGDATGSKLLLHIANWEGRAAGLGAARVPGHHEVEQRLHMTAVFTDPPLATIGMNAREAEQHGFDVIAAEAKFAETGRAITMDVQHGAWKLVADRKKGEILGAQILGPRADDIVHTIATVMYYRGTAADMLQMPWYHPTVSEVALGLAREIRAQIE